MASIRRATHAKLNIPSCHPDRASIANAWTVTVFHVIQESVQIAAKATVLSLTIAL